jgi:hypothetical protein
MHFSLNLLKIKGLYMFRALLAHTQEALHKLQLVFCVRMSVGCETVKTYTHTHTHIYIYIGGLRGAIYEKMWKNVVQSDRPQMAI